MEIAPTGMSGSLMLRTSFPSEGGRGDWGSTSYRTTCRATGSCTCEGKERMNIHIIIAGTLCTLYTQIINHMVKVVCMHVHGTSYKQWVLHG